MHYMLLAVFLPSTLTQEGNALELSLAQLPLVFSKKSSSFFLTTLFSSLHFSLCSRSEQVFEISNTIFLLLQQHQLQFFCCCFFTMPPASFSLMSLPQGFKGKTGHVGFPGQKVSQQTPYLIIVP